MSSIFHLFAKKKKEKKENDTASGPICTHISAIWIVIFPLMVPQFTPGLRKEGRLSLDKYLAEMQNIG